MSTVDRQEMRSWKLHGDVGRPDEAEGTELLKFDESSSPVEAALSIWVNPALMRKL